MTNLSVQEKQRLAHLVNRYLTNKSTPEEIKELGRLLHDPTYEAYLFELLKGEWETVASSIRLRAEHTDELLDKIQSTLHAPAKKSSLLHYPQLSWRMAASIALLAIASFMVYQFRSNFFGSVNEDLVKIENPAGKRIQVTLPDSSRVWLNGQSTLTYPAHFERERRAVALQGEAFFEVIRNERKPFIITSAAISLKVLGTSFNVQSYNEDEVAIITVATGKVQVNVGHDQQFLVQGEQLRYNKSAKDFERLHVNANESSAWRDGWLIFNSTSLADVSNALARAYNLRVVLEGEALKKTRVTFKHKNKKVEDVLELLSFTANFSYKISNNVITIKPKE